jgi:Flp pilus assembly pilin Flp
MFDCLHAPVARLVPADGQAMVEYALLLGLVTVVAVGGLGLVGGSVNGMLNTLEGMLSAVPGA